MRLFAMKKYTAILLLLITSGAQGSGGPPPTAAEVGSKKREAERLISKLRADYEDVEQSTDSSLTLSRRDWIVFDAEAAKLRQDSLGIARTVDKDSHRFDSNGNLIVKPSDSRDAREIYKNLESYQARGQENLKNIEDRMVKWKRGVTERDRRRMDLIKRMDEEGKLYDPPFRMFDGDGALAMATMKKMEEAQLTSDWKELELRFQNNVLLLNTIELQHDSNVLGRYVKLKLEKYTDSPELCVLIKKVQGGGSCPSVASAGKSKNSKRAVEESQTNVLDFSHGS